MIGENAMKDSELIQKVHSGNKEAVGIIIERYYVDIYRFCLYMVQTEDDAYDIAQETFLKFMKYGTSYKHHNLKGYLRSGGCRLFEKFIKGTFAGYEGSYYSAYL